MTRKKARFFGHPKNLPSKTASFLRARMEFIEQQRPYYSLDETSFGRHGRDSKGYAPKGQKLIVKSPLSIRIVIGLLEAFFLRGFLGSLVFGSFSLRFGSLGLLSSGFILLCCLIYFFQFYRGLVKILKKTIFRQSRNGNLPQRLFLWNGQRAHHPL
jgi:hypothetical protein